ARARHGDGKVQGLLHAIRVTALFACQDGLFPGICLCRKQLLSFPYQDIFHMLESLQWPLGGILFRTHTRGLVFLGPKSQGLQEVTFLWRGNMILSYVDITVSTIWETS